MAELALEHVGKVYRNGYEAIHDFSLEIKEGEFLILVGPSGCGKSTLLRMIAGFNSIEAGTISFGDQVINELPTHQRNIGMVFQSYAIFPHLTVRQNVEYGLKIRKLPRDEMKKRVDEMLKLVRIDEYQDRLPERLSGGQQRRVAIAGVIAMHPDFLILDEPSAGLDPVGRREIFSRIQGWYKKGVFSVILVSHNMDDIARLATRLLVMHQGRLVLDGDPMDIFLHHRETLKECGVDAPPLTQTLLYLKEKGIPVPETARTVEEAAEKMYAVLGGGK